MDFLHVLTWRDVVANGSVTIALYIAMNVQYDAVFVFTHANVAIAEIFYVKNTLKTVVCVTVWFVTGARGFTKMIILKSSLLFTLHWN